MPPSFLPLILLAPFAGILAVALTARVSRKLAAWTAGVAMAAGLAPALKLAPEVFAGGVVHWRVAWLPEWGLDLALRFDGLGLLFTGLILGIGVMIVLYAAYYLPKYDDLGRFYMSLLGFAGGMLGIVLAENIILMVVFWEVTSLTSFLLIAYKYQQVEARISARMALAVTGGGGLALLAGALLLGDVAGSFDFSVIEERGALVRADGLYPVILILFLLGAFTKSAQFPFHFWLPNAMAAPTPVSAYLHSATMVKAGVFLLARMYPVLAGTDLWFVTVTTVGAITFVYGAYVALLKHDLKGLLAYSTVSHLGLITLLFGLDTPLAAVAAVFHIINHAIFKASLFMSAGIIDHETGTRDMRRMGGLFKTMPRTAVLGILAAGSMAGVPLLNGFLSKEMFFTAAVAHENFGGAAYILPVVATLGGMLGVAYSVRFVWDVFFDGPPKPMPKTPHEPPMWMRLPVEVLVALVLIVGFLPQVVVGPILLSASEAVLPGAVPQIKLAVWHGFNLPLAMTVIAFGLGVLQFTRRHTLYAWQERFAWSLTSPVAFERFYRGATRFSSAVMALSGARSLQRNLVLFFSFLLVAGAWAWVKTERASDGGATLIGSTPVMPIDAASSAAFAILIFAACSTVFLRHNRLLAVIFLSVAGTIVSLAFLRFNAPDLALTQLTVEVVTIVLLLMSLRYLPPRPPKQSSDLRRLRDWMIAMAAGTGVTVMAFAMLTRPYDTIAGYHMANAKPGGGGTNVVNVILVDFRGYDTLGEITVLAMAALGLCALLAGVRMTQPQSSPPLLTERSTIMLSELMRPLLPLSMAVAVYIFLRGHNLPGGGFIAGLVAAIALMLQYVASGMDFATERLRVNYVRLLGAGLGISTLTGMASFVFGNPFLTSTHGYVTPPLIDKFELASAMAFDLGVFLVVVGTVLLAMTVIAGLKRAEQPAPGEG
ncbi:MAG: monovalent cation/H+ antiporter subunit A [Hyphomicrobium sp.]|nr:monovalent cation/H+ antiporter subunit A [Hyphomicrobium sp.]